MVGVRFAGCFALIVGAVTFTIALASDVRMTTIVFRSFVSVAVFGVLGYFLPRLVVYLLTRTTVEHDQEAVVPMECAEVAVDPPFHAFTPDSFEQISSSEE